MNWKLIFQLSFFGLIMAFATVSLIPEKVEPVFWLVIFVFCAYVIARAAPGKYFLHGFLVSMVNSIWITAVHCYFYKNYAVHHPDMVTMYTGIHPRRMMLCYGPVFGAMFGIVLGLFAFIASKFVKKPTA
ncbi:MAG: hypothetical protein JWQ34_3828 [Mucilaginibacter sp.]|uniref:hypothetical protein n=1 Tax=Mucilaginibacter sp. TaxID=1882438 RepID=UPI00261CE87C|nr:hypothetical protein [Mucilaginibacter sp.]MDB5005603.1 hypothetical protein [Mucilaginibacter sp.]